MDRDRMAGFPDQKVTGYGAPGSRPSREDLKRRLFRKCDKDNDGFLKKAEMRELASLVGFEGNDEEWMEEYEKLCSEHRLRAEDGIPSAVVMELLDDQSDNGCYCTDQEITELLDRFFALRAAPTFDSPVRTKPSDNESCKVFFAGANFNSDEVDLRMVFEEVGRIVDFVLFRMQDHRSRGMGLVTYSSPEEARQAIAVLHQREVEGRLLLVQEDTSGGRHETSSSRQTGNNQWAEGHHQPKSKGSSLKGWKGGKDGKDGGGKDAGRGWLRDDRSGGNWSKGGGKHGRGYEDHGYYPHDSHWDYQPDVIDYYGYDTDGYTVFFAGASFDTTPGHLKKLFQEAGRILQFWLFQLPDGRSRGMGVVQYESMQEAQYAIEIMHARVVDGRSLLVKIDDVGALISEGMGYAGTVLPNLRKGGEKGYRGGGKASNSRQLVSLNAWSNRVFFAGAPFHCSEGTLRSYFEEVGHIRSFTVFWLNDGRHRGMGVCTYATSEIAQRALNGGIIVDGRPLFLQEDTSQYAQDDALGKGKGGHQALPYTASHPSSYGPSPRREAGRFSRSTPYTQDYDYMDGNINVDPAKAVFFANVPFEVTETYLRNKFEKVGTVKNLIIFTTADGKSRGMGVVEYTNQAAAMRAYNTLHEQMVCGRIMIVDEYRPPQ